MIVQAAGVLSRIVLVGSMFMLLVACARDTPRPTAQFDAAYVAAQQGRVTIEIPEVYELANIALAITPEGLNRPGLIEKEGLYYQRVLDHFLPYKDHPLIATINYTDIRDYYGFRENSFAYSFEGDAITDGGQYANIRPPNLFAEHRALVEDFAKVSRFKEFYRANTTFYQEQVDTYQVKIPIRNMWSWLEERFPNRYNSYKIVFSPLIGGSHSTVRFTDNGLAETVMFVSGPERYGKPVSPAIEAGLLARVVFTEIDHNYVNPVTETYKEQVDSAFSKLQVWAAPEKTGLYPTSRSIFNEYMTWAVFILYIHDTEEPAVAQAVTDRTVEQMVEMRGFVQFRSFSEQLLKLYREQKAGQTLVDVYPEILAWAEQQQ